MERWKFHWNVFLLPIFKRYVKLCGNEFNMNDIDFNKMLSKRTSIFLLLLHEKIFCSYKKLHVILMPFKHIPL